MLETGVWHPNSKRSTVLFYNYVDNSEYFTTSTFNNVVRSQVGFFFILHENTRSFGRKFDEFHSFASELSRAADVIVLSETWFSAILVVMFRDTLAFIHAVLTNREAASLCL